METVPIPALGAFTRRSLFALSLAAAALALPGAPAFAYDPASASQLNVDAAGLALRGHDPVAYFTAGKPMKGDAKFTATHAGATYQFASAANRDAFLKEPDRFAPQYGGFCAMGAAMGKKLDGDPNLWRVVGDKLYLNVSQPAQTRWATDIPGFVRQADGNWPKIRDKRPDAL